MLDAEHWVANVRQPVRFSQAIAAAGADHSTFIEINPYPMLTHTIADVLECVASTGRLVVTSATNRAEDQTLFFHSQLATLGVTPPEGSAGRLVDIPPTPWLHSRYWMANPPARARLTGAHPLLGVHVEIPSRREHVWRAEVDTQLIPWLADHEVYGQPVMPTAAFAEMALAAGSEALGLPVHGVGVSRLEVEQMLALDGRTELTTQLVRGANDGIHVEIHSRSNGGDWCRHAVAGVDVVQGDVAVERFGAVGKAATMVSPADFYAALRRTGAHHGQAFAALTRIVRMPGVFAETEIVLPDEAVPHRGYRVHPVMLEAALQSLAAAMPGESLADSAEVSYLPTSLETIRMFGDVGRRARCRAEVVSVDDDDLGVRGRVTMMDDAGITTAEITGVCLRHVQRMRQLGYFANLVGELDALDGGDRSPVDDRHRFGPAPDWSQMSAEDACVELESRLRAILARELQMSASALNIDQPFPELGLDSMMAMTILRETRQLVGIDLSATMFWDHPTISSLVGYLADVLAPQQVLEERDVDLTPESTSSVLDALFDSVESAHAGSESGIR